MHFRAFEVSGFCKGTGRLQVMGRLPFFFFASLTEVFDRMSTWIFGP